VEWASGRGGSTLAIVRLCGYSAPTSFPHQCQLPLWS
jgi:hypothetical protein